MGHWPTSDSLLSSDAFAGYPTGAVIKRLPHSGPATKSLQMRQVIKSPKSGALESGSDSWTARSFTCWCPSGSDLSPGKTLRNHTQFMSGRGPEKTAQVTPQAPDCQGQTTSQEPALQVIFASRAVSCQPFWSCVTPTTQYRSHPRSRWHLPTGCRVRDQTVCR